MRKLTIAKRIQLSNLISIGMILIVGFLSFHYFNQMHSELERIVTQDIQQARKAEEIKSTIFDLQRSERTLLRSVNMREAVEHIQHELKQLRGAIQEALQASQKPENIAHYRQMLSLHGQYESLISDIVSGTAAHGTLTQLSTLRTGMRNANAAVLEKRYQEIEIHQADARRVASTAERNMIVVLLLVLIFAGILGVASPHWVSAPFKKLMRALADVRTGKLNTIIPVRTDDEVGALTKALNSTIASLREFDDMKVQRIAFEGRRFDALANMVDYGVVVIERDGTIRSINSQLYLLLDLHSEDVVGKRIEQTPLPEILRDLLLECLEMDEKFDNHEITLQIPDPDNEDEEIDINLLADDTIVRSATGEALHYIVTFEDKGAHVEKRYLKRKIAGVDD